MSEHNDIPKPTDAQKTLWRAVTSDYLPFSAHDDR